MKIYLKQHYQFLDYNTNQILHSKFLMGNDNSSIGHESDNAVKPTIDPSNHENQSKSIYEGPKFYLEQMLTGCLSIYSYYIESQGEAFIIDPQNDISKYEEVLNKRKTKLVGVFLTHYHADYIAGHQELAHKIGCKMYMGPKAVEHKGLIVLKDLERVKVGAIELQLLHTPGHTEESSCLLLIDGDNKQNAVFTGDTVFLGEVGRPDLAVRSSLTAQDLAELLFDSIQKIKNLKPHVRIYPGHGAGSSCGKSIGAGDFCDIGTQMQKNYAFQATDKGAFVKQILNQMPSPPQYFPYDAKINKFEPFSFQQKFKQVNKELSVDQVHDYIVKQNITIIDVRGKPEVLKQGIIKGSICIGFYGAFATWLGTLMDPSKYYIVYGLPDQVTDTLKRMLRIGYINIKGYANFDIEYWKERKYPYYIPEFIEVDKVQKDRHILDVRKPKQWAKSTLNFDDLVKLELARLFKSTTQLDPNKKYAIHCAGGYRAMIAYSFLKNNGYDVKPYPFKYDLIAEKTGLGVKAN